MLTTWKISKNSLLIKSTSWKNVNCFTENTLNLVYASDFFKDFFIYLKCWVIKINFYLFEMRDKEKEIFIPKGPQHLGLGQVGFRNQEPHWIHPCEYREPGAWVSLEVYQPRFEPSPRWDASTAGSGLTHWSTLQIPHTIQVPHTFKLIQSQSLRKWLRMYTELEVSSKNTKYFWNISNILFIKLLTTIEKVSLQSMDQ